MVEPGGKWKRLGTLISLRSEISKSSITVSCSSSVPFIPSFTFTDDCGQPLLLTLEEVVLLILLMWSWLLWLVRRWNHRRIPSTSVPLPPIQNVFLISLFVYSHQLPAFLALSLSLSIIPLGLPSILLLLLNLALSLSPSLSSRVLRIWCVWVFLILIYGACGLGEACGGEGRETCGASHYPMLASLLRFWLDELWQNINTFYMFLCL